MAVTKEYKVYAEALRSSGMSKADLARATEMDYSRLCGYLNGYHRLPARLLGRVAAALGEYLPGGFGAPPPSSDGEGAEG
jgi:transcriptional regulator with XRE-family HTH domain